MSEKLDGPNYAHWMKLPAWREEEATALAIGVDPDSPEWRNDCDEDQKLKVREIERAFLTGMFPNREHIAPRDFLSAMTSNGYEFPVGLIAAAKAQKIEIKNWRFAYEKVSAELEAIKKQVASRKKPKRSIPQDRSLYKIILAMACAKYEYKIGASRNSAPSQIADDAKLLALEMTDDTVRYGTPSMSLSMNVQKT